MPPPVHPAEAAPSLRTRPLPAIRPTLLGLSLCACLIGLAVAHGSGVVIDGLTAGLTILCALAVHAGFFRACAAPPLAAGWLMMVVGSDFVQRGEFSRLPLIAGLSYALLTAASLFIDQFPGWRSDTAAGRRTLVVRLGLDGAKWAYLGLVLLACGWLVLMVGRNLLPQGAAAAALTLIFSFRAARTLLAHADEPAELAPALRLSIAAATLHGLVLAATLAFGRWPGALS